MMLREPNNCYSALPPKEEEGERKERRGRREGREEKYKIKRKRFYSMTVTSFKVIG